MNMDDKALELLERLNGQIDELRVNMATKEDIKNMATKDDIKNMATKEDIKNMATKEDIKNMATKEDIKNMATKDDLKNLATKDDLKLLADELHTEIQAVYDEVEGLRRDFNTIEMVTAKNSFDIATLKAVRNL
jgi:hypothetical protein